MNLTITPHLFNLVRNNNKQEYSQISSNEYPNLAPLKQDTVSFGVGEKLLKTGTRLPKQFGITMAVLLEKPFKMFTNKLESSFSPMLATANHPDRPIYMIKTRIKSPESIAEKAEQEMLRTLRNLLKKSRI